MRVKELTAEYWRTVRLPELRKLLSGLDYQASQPWAWQISPELREMAEVMRSVLVEREP